MSVIVDGGTIGSKNIVAVPRFIFFGQPSSPPISLSINLTTSPGGPHLHLFPQECRVREMPGVSGCCGGAGNLIRLA